jgi:hypothetical protein
MLQFKYHHVTESYDCDTGQSGITFDQLRTLFSRTPKSYIFACYFMWAKNLVSHFEERVDCEVTTEILVKSKRVGVPGSWRQFNVHLLL